MKLRKVNPTGERYGHFYEVNNVLYFVECTKKEYEALGKKGAKAPDVPGVWVRSIGGAVVFDTENGFLQEGDYWEPEPGKAVISIDGVNCLAKAEDIVDGELKPDAVVMRPEPLQFVDLKKEADVVAHK